MKAKLTVALCLLLVMSLVCSISAYAASGNEIETTITYTKQADSEPEPEPDPAPEETPSDDEPSRPVYEIAIPSEMSMSNGTTLPIYLTENNIPEGYVLSVYIDGSKSYGDDGFLHLSGTKGQADALVIINRYDVDGSYMAVTQQPYPKVAAFVHGNIRPIQYGTLNFTVIDEEVLPPDTYTGRIYFDLSLVLE